MPETTPSSAESDTPPLTGACTDCAILARRMDALEKRQEAFEQAIRDGLMHASMASYKVSGPVRKTYPTTPVRGTDDTP